MLASALYFTNAKRLGSLFINSETLKTCIFCIGTIIEQSKHNLGKVWNDLNQWTVTQFLKWLNHHHILLAPLTHGVHFIHPITNIVNIHVANKSWLLSLLFEPDLSLKIHFLYFFQCFSECPTTNKLIVW